MMPDSGVIPTGTHPAHTAAGLQPGSSVPAQALQQPGGGKQRCLLGIVPFTKNIRRRIPFFFRKAQAFSGLV